jgi:Tol biopolymer transport system component
MNQTATSRITAQTETSTPSPTSTASFVRSTPASIQRLPARIAYIAPGVPNILGNVIGVFDQDYTQTILVEGCLFCNSLAWSPDGKWIAFNATFKVGADGQIYLVNVENGEIRQITHDPPPKSGISWSPDGKYLIYAEEGDTSALVIRRIDGTFVKKITTISGNGFSPVWSPDGSKIAFLYSRERFKGSTKLWIMDQDGGNPRQLTDAPIVYNTLSWAPDGESILFLSSTSCNKLYSVQIDGSNLQKVLDYPGCIENPSWSPDGNYIMFIGSDRESDLPTSSKWKIYIAFANGSGISRLAVNPERRPLAATWDQSSK